MNPVFLNKIVFIDDDAAANEYHAHVARKANVSNETLFFETAESALIYFKSITSKYDFPDLVFIDIHMPGMNGHDFVTEVRELVNFNEDRTVLAYLSATMSDQDVAAYSDNDMKYFYLKSIDGFDLKKVVTEIFQPGHKKV